MEIVRELSNVAREFECLLLKRHQFLVQLVADVIFA